MFTMYYDQLRKSTLFTLNVRTQPQASNMQQFQHLRPLLVHSFANKIEIELYSQKVG
jgi:hypothetical protein